MRCCGVVLAAQYHNQCPCYKTLCGCAEQELEEVLGDEASVFDTNDMAMVLQPICEQLHQLVRDQASRSSVRPSAASAAADSGAQPGNASGAPPGGGGGNGTGAGAMRTGGLPMLPTRGVRGMRGPGRLGGMAAGGGGQSAAAEAWTGLSGPNESDAIKKFRSSLLDLRVSVIRWFTKLGYPATNPMLKQTLHRLELSEQQVRLLPLSLMLDCMLPCIR
jgi:hypothetical protein